MTPGAMPLTLILCLIRARPGRLGQADDRGLGGAIDRDQRLAAPAGLAGEVDDLAAAPCSTICAGHRLQREEQALHIDGELPVVALLGDLQQRRHVEDGGIVDQDVDAARRGDDLRAPWRRWRLAW